MASKRYCKRKELESLIGNLQHACKAVPQGRTFLRRMSTFSLSLGRTITLFVSTRTFTRIPPGGRTSLTHGMVLVSSFPLNGPLCLTFRYDQMRWAPLSMVYHPVVVAAALGGPRWSEKLVNEPSDPVIHLTPRDLQLDSTSNPSCLRGRLSVQNRTLFVRAASSIWVVTIRPSAPLRR